MTNSRARNKYDKTAQSCIMFATADWGERYWTNKQHCAVSLSKLGIKVLYVESVGLRTPNLRSARDLIRLRKRFFDGLICFFVGAREKCPNVFVLSPLVIPGANRNRLLRILNRWLLSFLIKKTTKNFHMRNSIIWTFHPFMIDLLTSLSVKGLLYHCVDDLGAVPGVDSDTFYKKEKELLRISDVVFVTSEELQKRCRVENKHTYFLPNVVDFEHFSKALSASPIPNDLVGISEPRICFHGVLSDFKIDFDLLITAAENSPNYSWVFIGEEREGQHSAQLKQLSALSNVYRLGYKTYDELPNYLRGMSVGILPNLKSVYTKSMFPMKYFEYVAAGLPIVSSYQAFDDNNNPFLRHARSPEKFVSEIENLLKVERISESMARSIVGENTWSERTKKMLSIFSSILNLN